MAAFHRLGLLTQLLIGFAAGAAFIAVLMVAGDRMLQRGSRSLVTTLEDHVRPLARLHRLQQQVASLRVRELQLAQLRDVFAVQGQVSALRAEMQVLDREIPDFARQLVAAGHADGERLIGHWQDYRSRLEQQARLASDMDLAAVDQIVRSGSHLPFNAIESRLAVVATETEATAERAYPATVTAQAEDRRRFLLLVIIGSLPLVAGLAWSGRNVVLRIRVLHEHAMALAEGQQRGDITISRHDEIGDLATAFDRMRAQVDSRETALREAQQELEARVRQRTADLVTANAQLTLLSQTVEQNPLGILIAHRDGRIEFVNPSYSRITGQRPEALIGQPLASAMPVDEKVDLAVALDQASPGGGSWEVELASQRADGTSYWERLSLTAIHDATGVHTHYLLSREDITAQQLQLERIAYQAHYDALTGLPNRVLAHDRLNQLTVRCRREHCKAVAMFIDLDNFKQINDTLGHAAGDALLRQAATRLRAAVRDEDTVARLGGDEFLITLAGLGDGKECIPVAEKLIAAFRRPFQIDDRELITSPSIGIAVFPDDGSDPMVLLRNADLAMYEAKEAGRSTYRFFNPSIHELSLQRLEIGRCLRGALPHGELRLVFHPLVSASEGRIVGAEALLRWTSAELGVIEPDVFIPVAEQNGQIIELGRWVLEEACATLAKWLPDHPGFVMAVNVSPREFRALGFIDSVRTCLAKYGLPPGVLEIEVTEGVLLRHQGEIKNILDQLVALGVRLSMDDFGTGYSSLNYLREFPFHTVKIDRSFIRDLSDDCSDRALVVAAIRMAQAMGLRIVAEGVETDAQRAFLSAEKCDLLQGFLFGMPAPAEQFRAEWVTTRALGVVPGLAPLDPTQNR